MADDITVRATLKDDLSRPLEDVRRTVKGVGDDAANAGRKARVGAGGFTGFIKAGFTTGNSFGGVFRTGLKLGLGVITAIGSAAVTAETKSKFGTVFKGAAGVNERVANNNKAFGLAKSDR